jgi:hypothetical protein
LLILLMHYLLSFQELTDSSFDVWWRRHNAVVAPGLGVGWRSPDLHLVVAAWLPLQMSSCLASALLAVSGLLAAPLLVGSIPLALSARSSSVED